MYMYMMTSKQRAKHYMHMHMYKHGQTHLAVSTTFLSGPCRVPSPLTLLPSQLTPSPAPPLPSLPPPLPFLICCISTNVFFTRLCSIAKTRTTEFRNRFPTTRGRAASVTELRSISCTLMSIRSAAQFSVFARDELILSTIVVVMFLMQASLQLRMRWVVKLSSMCTDESLGAGADLRPPLADCVTG